MSEGPDNNTALIIAISERLARLEAQAEGHVQEAREQADRAKQERIRAEKHFADLEREVYEVRSDLAQYRTWLGGALASLGLVIAIFKFFGHKIAAVMAAIFL